MLETAAERLSRARRPAFRLARQAPGGAARDHRGRRRSRGAVHHRHPDRHRRDAARAHRGAAGAARPARAPRPPAGNHHPEFPRQARHPHGATRPSRRSTIICGPSRSRASCSAPAMNIQAPPNLAAGALAAPDRGRHQRLGRRLAGDARSRQSGAPWPALDALAARDRGGRQGAGRAARDLSGLSSRDAGRAGSRRRCGTRVLRHGRRRGLRARRRLDAGRRRCRRRRCRRVGPRAGRADADPRSRACAGRELERSATSSRCSPRAATSFHAVCAAADALRARDLRRHASATSSTATSTTPTSAPTAARSAPSPRARRSEHLRGRPYDLPLDEIVRRAPRGLGARRHRGLPAGRHPSATTPATTYLAICRAIKAAVPGHARPRLLAARGLAGRGDARHVASRTSSPS